MPHRNTLNWTFIRNPLVTPHESSDVEGEDKKICPTLMLSMFMLTKPSEPAKSSLLPKRPVFPTNEMFIFAWSGWHTERNIFGIALVRIRTESRKVQSSHFLLELSRQEADISLAGLFFLPLPQEIKLRQHLIREGTRHEEGILQRMRQRRLFLRRALNDHSETRHVTARHGVQLFADVNVTLHVALERSVVESADSGTNETWLEQCFRNGSVLPPTQRIPAGTALLPTEKFGANSEDVYVQENVGRAQ